MHIVKNKIKCIIFKKNLQTLYICGIISKRDCTRYALKREVAVFMMGNFRGVCPILNRAAYSFGTKAVDFFEPQASTAPRVSFNDPDKLVVV